MHLHHLFCSCLYAQTYTSVVKHMHGTYKRCILWHSTILPEMARVRQPHPSNTYSTIDDVEVPTDSIALELNPAYDAAEDGPALSHNLGTEAVISLNEGAVTFETPRDGRGVDEEIDRAEWMLIRERMKECIAGLRMA